MEFFLWETRRHLVSVSAVNFLLNKCNKWIRNKAQSLFWHTWRWAHGDADGIWVLGLWINYSSCFIPLLFSLNTHHFPKSRSFRHTHAWTKICKLKSGYIQASLLSGASDILFTNPVPQTITSTRWLSGSGLLLWQRQSFALISYMMELCRSDSEQIEASAATPGIAASGAKAELALSDHPDASSAASPTGLAFLQAY